MAVILCFDGTIATAHEKVVDCPNSQKLIFDGLHRETCQLLGSVTIERYRGEKKSSPYATDFDRRELVVADGIISMAGLAKIVSPDNASSSFNSFDLLQPPMTDQIFRVSRLPLRMFQTWAISADIVRYKTQGDVPGFDLTCALAKRTVYTKSTAVMECFPSEGRANFYSVLNSLK